MRSACAQAGKGSVDQRLSTRSGPPREIYMHEYISLKNAILHKSACPAALCAFIAHTRERVNYWWVCVVV